MSGQMKKILLIEDVLSMSMLYEQQLRASGLTTIGAVGVSVVCTAPAAHRRKLTRSDSVK